MAAITREWFWGNWLSWLKHVIGWQRPSSSNMLFISHTLFFHSFVTLINSDTMYRLRLQCTTESETRGPKFKLSVITSGNLPLLGFHRVLYLNLLNFQFFCTKVPFSSKLDNFSTWRTSKTLDERTEIRFLYSRTVNRDWILVQFLNERFNFDKTKHHVQTNIK